MVNYKKSLLSAWSGASKNKSLLFAYILQIIANLVLFAIVFIPQMPYVLQSLDTTAPIPQVANKTLLLFMLFTIIDLAILIIFNAWYKAGILGMLNAVVEKKKPTAKIFFQSARKLWQAFLAYQIVRFALVFITALPLTIFGALYLQSNNQVFILPIILSTLLFLFGWFLLSVSLFFAIPGVVREKMSAMSAISESFSLFKKQKLHVLKSFFIYLALMILTIAISFAGIPITSWLETIGADNSWRYVISAASFIIITIITIVATLFMLDMYKKK